jgi:hypothetical protein
MAYVDEALKLDARALMGLASLQGAYEVRLSYLTGHVKCGDLRENPDRVVSASITVKWPTRAGDPASGDVLVGYRLWGDRPAAQTVTLRRLRSAAGCGGSPATKRSNRFRRFIWPRHQYSGA